MKKYKLLNTKGLLLTLGSAAAIVAPIATVISCGTSKEVKKMDMTEIKQKIDASSIAKINSTMFQSLSGFELHSRDIYAGIFNNSSTGFIKNVTWFDDVQKFNGMLGGAALMTGPAPAEALIDKNLQVNGKPQAIDGFAINKSFNGFEISSANAALEFSVTKQDIINDKDALNKITTQINDYIAKNPGQYLATTSEITKDTFVVDQVDKVTKTATNGVYKVFVFKKSDTSDLVKQAASLLEDKSKFGLDLNMVRQLGGSYLWGRWVHDLKMNTSSNGLFGRVNTIKTSDVHNDRVEEDNIKSWTQYAPLTDSSVSQAEIDSLKDIHAIGRLEMDQKTHIYNLVITLDDSTSAETFYIPLPELTSFSQTQYSVDEIQDLLSKNGFIKFYNYISKFNIADLDLAGAAKRHIMQIMMNLPIMASYMGVIQNDSYMNDLINFTKTYDPSFDWNTFQESMKNMDGLELGAGDEWGAKRYSLMHHIEQFFNNASAFAKTPEGQKYSAEFVDVKDAATFYDLVNATK